MDVAEFPFFSMFRAEMVLIYGQTLMHTGVCEGGCRCLDWKDTPIHDQY